MPQRPEGADGVLAQSYSTAEHAPHFVQKNYPYTVYPFVTGQYLTTDGIQWSTVTTGSTGVTSKTSAVVTHVATTLSWPGLDKQYVDELEAGLTIALASTNGQTTCGFVWEMKNSTGSTWTVISSAAEVKSTKNWTERTNSGRVKTGTGYNRLPLNLRLKAWGKTASQMQAKIKNSSYVRVKAKQSA